MKNMDENHSSDDESDDDHVSEDDDDLTDLLSGENADDIGASTTAIRPDIVDKVFRTLSADAQRGDGQLSRDDINRIYLRRQLSIAECVLVEENIIAAGYRIFENDDVVELESERISEQRPQQRYLNEAEERELGRRIQLALQLPNEVAGLDPAYVDRVRKEAAKAKAIFVATNIRYVEQLARRRGQHQHLSMEDVMQEGFIGLLRATDLYEPERGFRFKTYATWWIEQRMRRAIADGDRVIRLPVHTHEKMVQIKRAKAKMMLTRGSFPTLDELATMVGMESERLLKLLWHLYTTDCAEGDAPNGEDSTLLSLVVDERESAFDQMLYKELQERFCDLLGTLSPREEHILRMRFGIGLENDYTFESVGQLYNLTRERIRQIEAKALKKLRHPTRSEQLSGFLDS